MRSFYLRHEVVVITVVAAIVYVAVGMFVRFLLNWIIGPLWPIVCVGTVPLIVRRVLGWDDPLPGERTAT